MATVAVANTGTASTTSATAGSGKPGSGRVSRRQGTASSSRKTNELGAGLVSLPPVPTQDPMTLVMTSPEVSPGKRVCPNCGTRVNRMNGFCPQCSAAYDFRPSLKNGDIVAGKYEIKGPIGLGGMGWIYLGFDIVLKRWVVLKGVLNEKDPEAAAAAIAERQFLAAVKHPNIVSIYDFVSQGSQGYMVLEYVGGRTLDAIRGDFDLVDLISPEDGRVVRSGVLRKDIKPEERNLVANVTKYGVLPPEQALAYLMALCPAFAYLHASGFTHNDMKPDNVMIDGDRVKLIDLGAMRKIGDQGGLIFGTEGFIAPEAVNDPDRGLRPLRGRAHAGDPADGLPLQVPHRHRCGDAQDDDAPAHRLRLQERAARPRTTSRCCNSSTRSTASSCAPATKTLTSASRAPTKCSRRCSACCAR